MTDQQPAPRSPHLAAFVAVAASLGFAVWLGLRGPEGQMPMHMGLDGTVDRWSDRVEAAWVLGGTTVFLAAAYALTAHSASKAAESVQRGLALVQAILIGAMVFVAALFGGLAFGVFAAVDGTQETHRLIGGFLAAVMLLIGSVLGKTPPNPWVGVRTYWALTSRAAWDKSNRLTGRLMFWGGLAGLPAAMLAPQPQANIGIGAVLILAALAGAVESWRVWNADPDRRTA
jgi:uncharacterized membrane protein